MNDTPGITLPKYITDWVEDNGERIEFELPDAEEK